MKKIVVLYIVILACVHANAQNKFSGKYSLTIDVSQVKQKSKMIYMWNFGTNHHYDSTKVVGDKAVFTGYLNEPKEVYISQVPQTVIEAKRIGMPDVKKGFFTQTYLVPGEVLVISRDSLSNYSLTGGKFGADYMLYREKYNDFLAKRDYPIIPTLITKKDSLDFIEEYKKSIDNFRQTAIRSYILEHLSSPVSLLAFNYYDNEGSPEHSLELLNALTSDVKDLPSAKEQFAYINKEISTAIGKQAPNFKQKTPSGQMVSLEGQRGKYVLLEFWASWCGPCRAENPVLKKSHTRYSNKGFAILSVSLDDEKKKWLKAIQDDKSGVWLQVSDLKGFDNEAALLYNVSAIPQNYLIDPTGKIIAKNLRGEELTKKLEEIFN